ncbi:MAG: hypothetical protein GYA36_18475 [Veillonellaceae bacterium]|nr:hypothetical protein [Veillonellaceae bacterium]
MKCVVILPVLTAFLSAYSWADWECIGPDGGELRTLFGSATDPNTIYAFNDYSPSRFVRSSDNGASWTVLGTIASMETCAEMGSGGRLYAGGNTEFFRSSDGGWTWTAASYPNTYFTALAAHPTAPDVIYGCGYAYSGSACSMFFMQSTNGGASLSFSSVGPANTYGYAISVSKTNPSVIFLSGFCYTGSGYAPRVYRSVNGGVSWSDVTPAGAASQEYSYAVAVSTADQNTVVFGTSSSIWRSADCGAGWTSVATDLVNPSGLQFSEANPDLVMCCGDTVVYRSADAGLSWSTVPSGTSSGKGSSSMYLHRTNQDLAFLGSGEGLLRSTDAGQSWTEYNGGVHLTEISAIGVTPSQPSRIFCQSVGNGIWSSTDNGANWSRLTTPLECGDFCGIVVKQTDPNTILALEGFG